MVEQFNNVKISKFTTWNVGCNVNRLLILHSNEDIQRTFDEYPCARILGNGSNILILSADTVVKLGKEFRAIHLISAISNIFIRHGKSGLEFMAGIPASLGGAIKTNAGGKYGIMSEIVQSVSVFQKGEVQKLQPKFGYRTSDITGLILDAEIKTRDTDPDSILRRTQKILQEKIKAQPLDKQTSGCVFKNPPNLYAGELIERCDIKLNIDGVSISNKHANFLITNGCVCPHHVLDAIQIIEKCVYDKMGVHLDREIDIWD